MGLILDSSALVASERQGQNARQMLAAIAREVSETEIAISVITPADPSRYAGPGAACWSD